MPACVTTDPCGTVRLGLEDGIRSARYDDVLHWRCTAPGPWRRARRALVGLARGNGPYAVYADELARAMRITGLDAVGRSLVELGFVTDAVHAFRDAQALCKRADLSLSPRQFPRLREMPRLIEEQLTAAIDRLGASELAEIARVSVAEAGREPFESTLKEQLDPDGLGERARVSDHRHDDHRAPSRPGQSGSAQPGGRFDRPVTASSFVRSRVA